MKTDAIPTADPIDLYMLGLDRSVAAASGFKKMAMAILGTAFIAELLNTTTVQQIGTVYLCSYYKSIDDWEVWISIDNPKSRTLEMRGALKEMVGWHG